ncbi:hypothetical protein EC844_10542 [Acinetobacter calcoaceticus]|uniref:Uncharacterized protein n=1 Tax=Acinetobacter calcoaceticus TaxID=471 RepID=A0A4R1XX59_ACICA|nr:hypothetical protein EC844_10542 [Acinetobacter calcoaceticus]
MEPYKKSKLHISLVIGSNCDLESQEYSDEQAYRVAKDIDIDTALYQLYTTN